jgi:peptidyl-prolyl cis-trans isomerase D
MSESFEKFRKQLGSGMKSQRWNLKSVTALVIFGAIIAVFALFGLPNRLNNGAQASGSAAQVNHTLISVADLRSESARLEQMYAPLFGGNMGDAQRQFVRQQALENLIFQEVSFQTAKKEGILATDAELQDMIVRELPYFQQNGRFQRDLYYQILEANHLTPAQFEEKLRKEKTNIRAQRLFEAAAQPLKIEVEKLKTLQENKLNIAFARLDKDKVISQMKSASVEAQLAKPEFAKKVQDYYAANRPEFDIQPEVKAQHILIKTGPQMTEAQAKTKIEEIQKRAKSEDFGKLAAQLSEDEGSKAKNGDLGFFHKGQMVPEFEKAAFSQKVGEVGEPVKTNFGYHLIKVTDKREGGLRPFEQVRMEIAQKLIASEAYEAEIKTLDEALAKNDTAAVDAQLKRMGVKWEETGFFDLNADMIPKLPSAEATKAALTLSEAQPNYPKVVRDGSEKFVLRFKGKKKEVSTDSQNLQAQLEKERANELFGSWIETAKKSTKIERANIKGL